MAKNAFQVLKYLLSLILAALLYFAFRGNDWKEFFEGVRSTRWGFMRLSLVVSVRLSFSARSAGGCCKCDGDYQE